MHSGDHFFLDLAQQRHWITRRQREKIEAEAQASGAPIADQVVRLEYLTLEQANELCQLAALSPATSLEDQLSPPASPDAEFEPSGPREGDDLETRKSFSPLAAARAAVATPVPAARPVSAPPSAASAASAAPSLPSAPVSKAPEIILGRDEWILPADGLLGRMLSEARSRGAMDLYATVSGAVLLRAPGVLYPWEGALLDSHALQSNILDCLSAGEQRLFEEKGVHQSIARLASGDRARLNLWRGAEGVQLAVRLLPNQVPSFESLGLPATLKPALGFAAGLIMIAGARGSGRTTSLHAIAREVMASRRGHVLRILRSVEYEFRAPNCAVSTWRVGREAASLLEGFRLASDTKASVILVDDIQFPEECQAAIESAEQGHLVLAAVSAETALRAFALCVEGIEGDAATLGIRCSEQCRAILSQRLLPRQDQPGGAVLAPELLLGIPQTTTILRSGRAAQVPAAIQGGKRQGMIPLDDALLELAHKNVLNGEVAWRAASNKQPFEKFRKPQQPESSAPRAPQSAAR